MTVTSINSVDDLETKLKKTPCSVVYFSATWSPLCRQLSPNFEKLSISKATVAFYKVDVDAVSDAMDRFKVREVPTVILFKKDSKVGDAIGDKANLTSLSNRIHDLLE